MAPRLKSSLIQLGFSAKSAAVYSALLGLGEASAPEIAKRAGLQRTTIYNLLPELLAKGLVRTALRNRRRVYFIEDPRHLRDFYGQQLARADEILPLLIQNHRVRRDRATVETFEGVQGIREFFHDTIRRTSPGDTIREIVGPHAFYSSLPRDLINSYVPDRVRKGVHIRIIASPSDTSFLLATRAEKELRQIRYTGHDSSGFHAATLIYGDRVGYISLKDDFVGVTIESETIAAMQREVFDALWLTLPSRPEGALQSQSSKGILHRK